MATWPLKLASYCACVFLAAIGLFYLDGVVFHAAGPNQPAWVTRALMMDFDVIWLSAAAMALAMVFAAGWRCLSSTYQS